MYNRTLRHFVCYSEIHEQTSIVGQVSDSSSKQVLTLYVPIIAILDMWKTTRVSLLSYISLPVRIFYDNPYIFLKLKKICELLTPRAWT